jgi:chromate transporter
VSFARVKPTRISSTESEGRPLAILAWIVMRTGVSTLGSGNTTSVLIGRELDRHGWFSPEQFDLCFTLARAVPGTNLFAFIAAVGWYVRGWSGALASVAALSIPASIVVVLLTLGYQTWNMHPFGKPAIEAAMASIVGVIAAAAWLIVRPRALHIRALILVVGGLLLSRYLSAIVVMALAAGIGYFWREPS